MFKEVLDVLKSRRSIRKYKKVKVSDELIKEVIQIATWAPSAHNAQPWRFIVLRDEKLKEKLLEEMGFKWVKDLEKNGVNYDEALEIVKESNKEIIDAPILIIPCLTMADMHRYPDAERVAVEHIMAIQSVAAAIQNLLIALHVYGLGACWHCAPLFCQEVVKEVLGLPDDYEPQAIVTVGYPDEHPSPKPRKPLEDIILWR